MRTNAISASYLTDGVLNASRQVWLASLGAAVVTRDWAAAEAGPLFRSLVKEGTLVESRTIRVVGDRLEGSFTRANTIWRRARSTMQTTVRRAADSAMTMVQNNLPKSLPKVTLPAMLLPKTPARKRVSKAAPARTKRGSKTAKRVARKTKARTTR